MSKRRIRRPPPTTDQRPPEVRLEAMVREPHRDRKERIIARIRTDLDDDPNPAPWLDSARTLWDRLIISEDTLQYLAEVFTECLVYRGSAEDPELVRLEEEMTAIERAHGLREDEYWHEEDAPADWVALEAEWNRRADEIVNSYLREAGHAALAEGRQKGRAELERRLEKGRTDLWGPDDEDYEDEGNGAPDPFSAFY